MNTRPWQIEPADTVTESQRLEKQHAEHRVTEVDHAAPNFLQSGWSPHFGRTRVSTTHGGHHYSSDDIQILYPQITAAVINGLGNLFVISFY